MTIGSHTCATRQGRLLFTMPLVALVISASAREAAAACVNGDPLDCNPAGQTLNPAARFVDPSPPPGFVQCAGFINTDQDDVGQSWENNCAPFKGGQLWLRLYDLEDNILAGARMFDPAAQCPWNVPTALGYDTDMLEGEGLLDQQGACSDAGGVSMAWYGAGGAFCGCGEYSCNDIYTANAANNKVLYVGGDAANPAREIVYGPPGGKGTCDLGGGAVFFSKLAIYAASPDADDDGVPVGDDNCPAVANPGQEDADQDALGDACDACPADADNDVDADEVCGDLDVCPADADPDQEDADADADGDACDVCPADAANDADADAVCGDLDNCPDAANPDQEDADMNGVGDACDVVDPTDTDSSTGSTTDASTGSTTEATTGSTTDATTDATTDSTTDPTTTTDAGTSTGDVPGSTGATGTTGAAETTATPTSDGTPTGGPTTPPGGDSTGEPGTGSTGSTGGTDGAGVDDGGCGCTTSGAPSTTALWLGLVGLGLRRRRRAA